MIRKVFVISMCLIYLSACHPIYYTTTPKELANQFSQAKIIKEIEFSSTGHANIEPKGHPELLLLNFLLDVIATKKEYIIRNNIVKLYLYDEEGKGDSIDVSFVNVKYITKYGASEYSHIIYESFKENYFFALNDTTNPKCKFFRIHKDSVIKIVFRVK
jgi:hypothetical protein